MYGEVKNSPYNPRAAKMKIKFNNERKQKAKNDFAKKTYTGNYRMRTPSPSYNKAGKDRLMDRSTADKFSSTLRDVRARRY